MLIVKTRRPPYIYIYLYMQTGKRVPRPLLSSRTIPAMLTYGR